LAKKQLKANTYGGKAYGGAALYADYLRQQVIPFVLARYRVDPNQKVFVGHSYGGLLGAHILLTRPDTFNSYILSSPSLWFDQGYMLQQAKQYRATKGNFNARVQLYAAEYEQIKAGARYARTVSIVADMHQFERILRQHQDARLHLESQVIADEDHLSVFPSMISRALVKLLPGYGPYTPG
jgi:predicted alpha/beta superfamily hydrolase